MEQQVAERRGMPRSVVVTPVLMLVAGAAASVGLWVFLTQEPPQSPPRLVRSTVSPPRGLLDGTATQP